MRVIARTSHRTGVSVGPLGLFVLQIGGLLALVVTAAVVVATYLAAGLVLAVGEVRRRRGDLA